MTKLMSRKIVAIFFIFVMVIGLYLILGYKKVTDVKSLLTYEKSEQSQITNYNFIIAYDDNNQTVKGNLTVEIPNSTGDVLEELYFHLYPNAFSNWKWEEEYKPRSEGSLKVNKALINNVEVIPHQKDTLLKINLPVALNPDEIVEVKMDFQLKVPTNGIRLTHEGDSIFLAQWYPMLAVYDDKGWNIEPYTTIGDPFYTEIANYNINLTIPEGYYAITSASDSNSVNNSNWNIILSQQNIRDFSLVITKEYEKISALAKNNIKVNLYYLPEQQEVAALLLGGATDAMDFYGKSFGEYPMKEIDIVLTETNSSIAGMEYPGIITANPTSKNIDNKVIPAYNVVAHEIAHQWWYGVVGNDQVNEPWLDEGLTTFSEYLYMEQVLNIEDITSLMAKVKKYTDDLAKEQHIGVLQSIYTYRDNYSAFIYARPAAMIWEIKNEYGLETVEEILREYYDKYKFKVATTEDFIDITSNILDKDMTSFFLEWLIVE